MAVRTRFAPSPTGFLQVGGARTALFSWLYARKHGGRFVLRIEDTDLERSTQESVNAILEGMTWLGLEYDEGPFYQTHRFERYNEVIGLLMDKGLAYRCNCSKERLETLREAQMARKEKPRYDGHCRDQHVSPEEDHVIRFRTPLDGEVVIDDEIRGRVVVDNAELDDLVIRRTDGSPTYNLTVVVDDHDMEISHVIRGDDHLNNAPRQVHMMEALGWQVPTYAHVPMILGDDGARLSKRHGAVSVMQYMRDGYLPEALLNYLVRLGWSHGDQELFSIDDMIQLFELDAVNRSPSSFNTEKLRWLNQQYIRDTDSKRIAHLLSSHLGDRGIDPAQGPDVVAVVEAQRERASTLEELADISLFYYRDFEGFDEKAAKKAFKGDADQALEAALRRLEALADWGRETIHETIAATVSELGVGFGKVAQPVRLALTGRMASPGLFDVLAGLGRDESARRLRMAAELVEKGEVPVA